MARSIAEINEKIERGNAVVLTAQEVCDIIKGGEDLAFEDVDVVTTATRAIMSGTYVVLSFPMAEPCSFIRAERAWINNVPASIGPCPNERLGIIDLMVFGTSHSKEKSDYGGGHLFRDIVEGKEVQVKVETSEDESFTKAITLEDIPYARIFSTRNAFKNYVAFVNPRDAPLPTIFSALDFPPGLTCATVSGCGQLNPIKNDPYLETIGIGTRILLNGSEGFVIGTGTRSMATRPNLLGLADMHQMNPEYMGGFVTSAGPECIGSWAVPIPVLNESILENIKKLDKELSLPIMDVNIRQVICTTNYEDVWGSTDLEIEFDPIKCINCTNCTVEPVCPMRAITLEGGQISRDKERCFNCGLCTSQCIGGAFKGNLGTINFEGKKIPIILRQSDRARAIKLAEELKLDILDGSFRITKMVEHIRGGL
ncbi:MAG: methanogenesis marker 16 metalloprotein [Methanotrichaceae archaeon]|nr:methanogenesis marker 16 metalloprotein [Methanotrichaceae archaeon]